MCETLSDSLNGGGGMEKKSLQGRQQRNFEYKGYMQQEFLLISRKLLFYALNFFIINHDT